ncbi:MAG: hypothetical protein H6Q72_3833 [Firmicutes bacterium]|nr:hypothetical protein [Bacillota bacterium]
MLQRAAATDTKLIIKGLMLLVTIVIVGVGIVEHQMAALTQRPVQERLFYIKSNTDYRFLAPMQGYVTAVDKGIWPDTLVSLTEDKLVVTIGQHSFKLPIKLQSEINKLKEKHWFALWHQQFVDEAVKTKEKAWQYWQQIKPYIETTFQKVKVKSRLALEKLEENIREYR